jgi:large subunit ribosomal protein L3
MNAKIIGKKLKMDQIYKNDRAIGITPIQTDPAADLSVFKEGDLVKVSGISKGRGFQGVVKRYGFSGGPKTHGQKNRHRGPGSIGNTSPQRVLPGRRMPGHMGAEKATVKNLEIVGVDNDKKTLFIKGGVPGNKGGKLEIRK